MGLTCPVDDVLLDDTMSFDVTSQVPLESLEVTTSRVDIIPSDGYRLRIWATEYWRVTLAPVGDREAFALLSSRDDGVRLRGKSVFARIEAEP